MNEPNANTARSLLAAIVEWLPGFGGYDAVDERARADAEQRAWLAERLERGKQGLERYLRVLADSVQLDAVGQADRLRRETDQLSNRIRGAMRGGGGLLGGGPVDAARLERVYEHDLALIEQVAATADLMESLGGSPSDAAERLDRLASQLQVLAGVPGFAEAP
ncbi:MAG: hypothetical protein AAGB00_06010, partial [Planctomycetota bacterium]